jgi:hypothetical protein
VDNLLWTISGSLEALAGGAPSSDRQTLIAGAPSAVDDAAAHLDRLSVYAVESMSGKYLNLPSVLALS